MPKEIAKSKTEEGYELRKKVIFFLMSLIIVSFFIWAFGSCQLYSGTGWRSASFSFLTTSPNAESYFSRLLSFVVFLNLTLTTVIVSGYARRAEHSRDVRSFFAVWVIFALANISLVMLAWTPLTGNYLWHWIFGTCAVYFNSGAIYLMSRMIRGEVGKYMVVLMLGTAVICGVGWVVTGGLVFPEVAAIVAVLMWHYLMTAGLYPEIEETLVSSA